MSVQFNLPNDTVEVKKLNDSLIVEFKNSDKVPLQVKSFVEIGLVIEIFQRISKSKHLKRRQISEQDQKEIEKSLQDMLVDSKVEYESLKGIEHDKVQFRKRIRSSEETNYRCYSLLLDQ